MMLNDSEVQIGFLNVFHSYFISIFFFRLFVEKLPKHPGYKDAPQNEVANIRQVCYMFLHFANSSLKY